MMKTDYPKIDIYVDGEYVASTTWNKTCRDAKLRYAKETGVDTGRIKTYFAKKG